LRSICGGCHSLAGAQILTWIGAKVFQAGKIAEKVLLPFVYVTAEHILAAYLHPANGVDDSSARGCRVSRTPEDASSIISLPFHRLPLSKPSGSLKKAIGLSF
jgi:hypothetical protein